MASRHHVEHHVRMLWPIGLPATLFFSMWRERKLIQEEDRDTLQKFDFALGDYKLSHWYWEVVRCSFWRMRGREGTPIHVLLRAPP